MLYAGFDCSTQSLTGVVIDADRREVVFRDEIAFAAPFESLAERGAVHASPLMWAQALEAMLGRVAGAIERPSLRAISGSAQQHGSVYCGTHPTILTRESSPIWMDTSTARECEEIEAALGGPQAVAQLTGSRAYPRFTGPQIRKFAREDPDAYHRTSRIHLVSSYLSSLLLGDHGPVDHADASGMNLMDIGRRKWCEAALAATAPDLRAKLPRLVPSAAAVGTLNTAWQARHDLPPVNLIAWSGDNPCSLVGTGLIREGQFAISLGTSDTIFGPMAAPRVSDDGTGHVFASPLGDYMGITVFRNGSLARERVRRELGMTWGDFSDALRRTSAGNTGVMMLPWFEAEITPRVDHPAPVRLTMDTASLDQRARAIIEAQAMALRRHSAWMGVAPDVIHATGGASVNREILQVIADVFNARVCRFSSSDSAALGAALRAYQGDSGLPWAHIIEGFVTPIADPIHPVAAHVEIYEAMLPACAAFEARALTAGQAPR